MRQTTVSVLVALVVVSVAVAASPAGGADTTGPDDLRATQTGNWTTNLTQATAGDGQLRTRAPITAVNGTVFVEASNADATRLAALSATNGSLQWSRSLGVGGPDGLSAPAGEPADATRWTGTTDWSPENVFVGDYTGTLYALDADTGQTAWQATTGFGSYVGDPLVGNRTVYVTAYDPVNGTTALQAFNATDGTRLWSVELGTGVGVAAPAGTPERLVVTVGTTAYGVNATNESLAWTTELDAQASTQPVVTNETAVVTTRDGTVTGLNLTAGDTQWRQSIGNRSTGPAMAGDLVVVGGENLTALDASDGTIAWTSEPGTPTAPPTVDGSEVYAAVNTTAYTVNATTGATVGSTSLDGVTTPVRVAPALTDEYVAFVSRDSVVSGVPIGGEISVKAAVATRAVTPTAAVTQEETPGFGVVAAVAALVWLVTQVRRQR